MNKEDFEELKVLVVEDDIHTRRLILQILRGIGVGKLYEAEEGGSGFRETVRVRPDVVICDINMEPVDGLAYLSQVRAFRIPDIATTPVIFLTGDALQQTVVAAKRLSVDGYLVKPVSPKDVKARIGSVLAAGRQRR